MRRKRRRKHKPAGAPDHNCSQKRRLTFSDAFTKLLNQIGRTKK